MAGPRNPSGVNDMAQLYRTVKGERYVWHYAPATNARVAAYRNAGVRCRRFQIDFKVELFIHPADADLAESVDLALAIEARRDSDSRAKREDPRSGAEAEGRPNGAEGNRPPSTGDHP